MCGLLMVAGPTDKQLPILSRPHHHGLILVVSSSQSSCTSHHKCAHTLFDSGYVAHSAVHNHPILHGTPINAEDTPAFVSSLELNI